MSNWTGMRTVRKRGGMAQSVEHIVHIDGVVGSSPTVTTPSRKKAGGYFYAFPEISPNSFTLCR